MKEILIVSGKGGAGKTTVASSLALFLNEKDVLVDADVDASDLPILFEPKIIEESTFYSGVIPEIDLTLCTNCKICKDHCKYNAIEIDKKNNTIFINDLNCEGCGLCSYICPENAISLKKREIGRKLISTTKLNIKMCHGILNVGGENSGKLVAAVKQDGRITLKKQKGNYIIIDGPPGIGCPVISAMTGVDIVITVIEPTLSGIHDAKRLVELAKYFNIKNFAIINKYGLNSENEESIMTYLKNEDIPLLGTIDYTKEVIEAQRKKILLSEYNDYFNKLFKNIWCNILKNISKGGSYEISYNIGR